MDNNEVRKLLAEIRDLALVPEPSTGDYDVDAHLLCLVLGRIARLAAKALADTKELP